MKSVHAQLMRRASEQPERIAIVDGDGRAWSFAALARAAGAVEARAAEQGAHHPQGAAPPVVAVSLRSGGALWAACIGAARGGCDVLLLPERPHERLRERVQRELTPVLTLDAPALDALASDAPTPDAPTPDAPTSGAPTGNRAAARSFGGVILVSSGTTGWSRFVRRTADAVDRIAEGLVAQDLYRASDVVGSFLPMHHAYGFEHAFVGPLLAGARVEQRASFSPAALCDLLEAGATVLPLVPATLATLAEPSLAARARGVRVAVSAGSPLGAGLRARVAAALGAHPVDLYGATELGTIWLDRGQGGVPVPGVRVRIVAPDVRNALRDMPQGCTGEIAVESATQFDRFAGAAQQTDELLDGWLRTGDLGVRAGDGSFRVVGRLKQVFDVGGLKVNPFEVEAALEEHPDVRAALVEPIEVAPGVRRVAARVELVPGAAAPLPGALRSFLAGRVPDHAMPRAIECVAALARTPSGKVLRGAMRPAEAPVVDRPGNLRERSTREAWTQDLFNTSADGYDASSGAAFMGTGRWYRRRMLRKAGLGTGMALLDVGSGTGLCAWIAQQLVGDEGRAVSLDPSVGMLAVARSRGVRETVVGAAEALPFEDGTFDMVSMSYMLRHVEDLRLAFGEARRVLRHGGRIVIFEVTKPTGRVAGPCFRAAMRHAVPTLGVLASRRASTYPMMRYWADTIDVAVAPEAIVSALQDAGFRGARHLRELGVFSCYRGVAV